MRTDIFLRTFYGYSLFLTGYGVIRQAFRGVPITPGFVFFIFMLSALFALPWSALTAWKYDSLVEMASNVAAVFDRDARHAVNARERILVPLAPEDALALCRPAVERVPNAKGVQMDSPGTLRARVGMSRASWGERITCRVRPVDSGSEVEIHSRPWLRTQIVDGGKNRENVERIRAALAELIGQGASPAVLADPQNELASSLAGEHAR